MRPLILPFSKKKKKAGKRAWDQHRRRESSSSRWSPSMRGLISLGARPLPGSPAALGAKEPLKTAKGSAACADTSAEQNQPRLQATKRPRFGSPSHGALLRRKLPYATAVAVIKTPQSSPPWFLHPSLSPRLSAPFRQLSAPRVPGRAAGDAGGLLPVADSPFWVNLMYGHHPLVPEESLAGFASPPPPKACHQCLRAPRVNQQKKITK